MLRDAATVPERGNPTYIGAWQLTEEDCEEEDDVCPAFGPKLSLASNASVQGRKSSRCSARVVDLELGAIPEHYSVRRLYFTVIGQRAWFFAQSLCSEAAATYPSLYHTRNSMPPCSASSSSSFLGRGLILKPEASALSCCIRLDGCALATASSASSSSHELGPRNSDPKSPKSPKSPKTPKSPVSPAFRSSGSFGREPSVDSHESASMNTARALILHWHPVESFSEDVPAWMSLEQWNSSCTVFLVDPRLDASGQILPDLARRRFEVHRNVESFVNKNQLKGVPNTVSVVLLHESPSEELGRYMPFVDSVRSTIGGPTGAANADAKGEGVTKSHHLCNFDNPKSTLECIVRIASSVVENGRRHGIIRQLLAEEGDPARFRWRCSCVVA